MKSITCLLSALAAGVAAIDMGPTYGKDYGGQGTPVRRLSNYSYFSTRTLHTYAARRNYRVTAGWRTSFASVENVQCAEHHQSSFSLKEWEVIHQLLYHFDPAQNMHMYVWFRMNGTRRHDADPRCCWWHTSALLHPA